MKFLQSPIAAFLAALSLKCFLSAALVDVALAADAPLTLMQAQRTAVERSRQVSAQDYGVAASREMAVTGPSAQVWHR
jgi:hypothetical protein